MKYLVLHIGRNNSKHEYSMRKNFSNEREILKDTELERDLGVNVDPELKISKHIEIQVNKANKVLGLIRRSYKYMDKEMLKNLFIALVRPHLEFANVVWNPRLIKDIKLIEGVQKRTTKVVNDLKKPFV